MPSISSLISIRSRSCLPDSSRVAMEAFEADMKKGPASCVLRPACSLTGTTRLSAARRVAARQSASYVIRRPRFHALLAVALHGLRGQGDDRQVLELVHSADA